MLGFTLEVGLGSAEEEVEELVPLPFWIRGSKDEEDVEEEGA